MTHTDITEQELIAQERDIARKFLGGVPWFAVIWGIGNSLIWLCLWPLVMLDIMPLWLGFIIACLNMSLAYLPSHEAQHDIIARPGEKLRWLNQLVGHVSVIPLAYSYHALRVTHMEHHKHTNDPVRDPDYGTRAPNAAAALWKTITNRQPSSQSGLNKYAAILTELGTRDAQIALRDSIIITLVYHAILFAIAWNGFALEAALLWWLPKVFGISYLQFYLSWAPHHPATETGRYRDTRAFKSIFGATLGNIISMGMQAHIVHHLYPRIPLTRTPAAYRALRPILEKRGCELSGM